MKTPLIGRISIKTVFFTVPKTVLLEDLLYHVYFYVVAAIETRRGQVFYDDPIVCFNVIALWKTFSSSALMEKAPFLVKTFLLR